MDKIQKLLMKISQSDRQRLLFVIQKLISNNKKNLNIVKIKNTNFYRVKSGKFRIIYHLEEKEVIIDAIRLRNEKTYRL
jgi:mRNA-degrading endonuclease RelE of RelBE toxin-antitoxin system